MNFSSEPYVTLIRKDKESKFNQFLRDIGIDKGITFVKEGPESAEYSEYHIFIRERKNFGELRKSLNKAQKDFIT